MAMTSTVLYYSLLTSDSWCLHDWNTRKNGIHIFRFMKYFQIALKVVPIYNPLAMYENPHQSVSSLTLAVVVVV